MRNEVLFKWIVLVAEYFPTFCIPSREKPVQRVYIFTSTLIEKGNKK